MLPPCRRIARDPSRTHARPRRRLPRPRPSRTAPAAEPIKVGFLAPMTGIFAQAGKDMLDGLKMALEQIGRPGGRPQDRADRGGHRGQPGHRAGQVPQARQPGQDPRAHRRAAGQHRLRPGAADRARPAARALPHHARTTSPSASRRSGSSAPNFAASQPMHPLGDYAAQDPQVQEGRRHRDGQPASATRRSAASSACSRTPAAAWCRRSGCRSTRIDFAPYLAQVAARRRRGRAGVRGRPGRALRQAVRARPGSRASSRSSAPASIIDESRAPHRWATRPSARSARCIWAPTLTTRPTRRS